MFSPDGKWLYVSAEEATSSILSTGGAKTVLRSRRAAAARHRLSAGFEPRLCGSGRSAHRLYHRYRETDGARSDQSRTARERSCGAPRRQARFISNGTDGTYRSSIPPATGDRHHSVGRRPWNMAITPDGKNSMSPNGRSNSVSIIDTRPIKSDRCDGRRITLGCSDSITSGKPTIIMSEGRVIPTPLCACCFNVLARAAFPRRRSIPRAAGSIHCAVSRRRRRRYRGTRSRGEAHCATRTIDRHRQ